MGQIPHAHDFCAFACTGNHGFHLFRSEVLRLVYDEKFVLKSAATHEVDRFDFDFARHHVVGGGAGPITAHVVTVGEHFQIVFECTHPRIHFLFFCARQKADVVAQGHGDAGHNDFAVALLVEHLG